MTTQRNALLDLAKFERVEHFVEFGLTRKDDLQQLLLRSFQVREQPDFFQQFRRKMVCFVDHQQGGQLALVPLHQKRTQRQNEFVFRLAGNGQSKITGDVANEFQR